VLFFLITIVTAVLAVLATKGSFGRLGQLGLVAMWALYVALGVQVVLEVVDFPSARIDDLGFALLLGTYVLILAFCYVNRRVQGITIVAIGVMLNVLVIALNDGMPAKDTVAMRGGRTVHEPIERTVKHKPESDHDRLRFLADVISLPGDDRSSFSVGDIVIAIGIIDVCFEGSRRPRRDRAYHSAVST
jgi:hypothetical protein